MGVELQLEKHFHSIFASFHGSWMCHYYLANIDHYLSFQLAGLADVVTLSNPHVAPRAEFWRGKLWRSLKVASHCLIVLLVERIQLRLQPRYVTLGLPVVHPELDLVYLVVQVPQPLFSNMAITIYQRPAMILLVTISSIRENLLMSHCSCVVFLVL